MCLVRNVRSYPKTRRNVEKQCGNAGSNLFSSRGELSSLNKNSVEGFLRKFANCLIFIPELIKEPLVACHLFFDPQEKVLCND